MALSRVVLVLRISQAEILLLLEKLLLLSSEALRDRGKLTISHRCNVVSFTSLQEEVLVLRI